MISSKEGMTQPVPFERIDTDRQIYAPQIAQLRAKFAKEASRQTRSIPTLSQTFEDVIRKPDSMRTAAYIIKETRFSTRQQISLIADSLGADYPQAEDIAKLFALVNNGFGNRDGLNADQINEYGSKYLAGMRYRGTIPVELVGREKLPAALPSGDPYFDAFIAARYKVYADLYDSAVDMRRAPHFFVLEELTRHWTDGALKGKIFSAFKGTPQEYLYDLVLTDVVFGALWKMVQEPMHNRNHYTDSNAFNYSVLLNTAGIITSGPVERVAGRKNLIFKDKKPYLPLVVLG